MRGSAPEVAVKVHVQRPTCPYCRSEITPAEPKVGCPSCMAWQHASCLLESHTCAACSRSLPTATPSPKPAPAPPPVHRGALDYRIFRSSWSSWEGLFASAATFATWAGRGLVSISHSADESDGVVTVWYRPELAGETGHVLRYQVVRGTWDGWDTLFGRAGSFAAGKNVVGVSHSEDKNEGVIAIWYWG